MYNKVSDHHPRVSADSGPPWQRTMLIGWHSMPAANS